MNGEWVKGEAQKKYRKMFSHSRCGIAMHPANVIIESSQIEWRTKTVETEKGAHEAKERKKKKKMQGKRHRKVKRYPNYVACDATLTRDRRRQRPTSASEHFNLDEKRQRDEDCVLWNECQTRSQVATVFGPELTDRHSVAGNEVLESDAFTIFALSNVPSAHRLWLWLYTRLIVSRNGTRDAVSH